MSVFFQIEGDKVSSRQNKLIEIKISLQNLLKATVHDAQLTLIPFFFSKRAHIFYCNLEQKYLGNYL